MEWASFLCENGPFHSGLVWPKRAMWLICMGLVLPLRKGLDYPTPQVRACVDLLSHDYVFLNTKQKNVVYDFG
uniref:Uncharacterized protein n=1 Tax=Timema poppense TaxID=170557 RepID=A0A7R9DN79_TIMPO|nr:unnamed protein product [Timema poppensis]